ncbi:extensin [Tardiphaga alba]|uniref:Extensin n=1 Tax=Tardiphaga alba TaxID=340268 RepID=A0ABX8AF37_9BRAD|nr:extensin family protein [Tardiphaga alba]QUS41546.1 extensin [Tardiphaga alba]
MVLPAEAYLTTTRVPLPKARPAEAPQAPEAEPAEKPGQSAGKPAAEAKPPEPPPPSACRVALTDDIAIAPSIPDIKGPGACGGPDMVRLEAVVLADKTRVSLKPAATMRCAMATAVADWVRTDMAGLAGSLKTKLVELDNFDSFSCRGRNRQQGAKLSEHGRANALDIRGLKLANGETVALTERTTPRDLREKVLLSLCSRFPTVLGPGSDGYHEDHIHFDLAERRGNYRICQWDVWDAWPQVAPLMPVPRPAEAPPREVAAKEGAPAEARLAEQPAEAQAEPDKEQAEEAKPEEPKAKPGQKKAKAKKPRKQRAQVPFPLNLLR